MTFKNSIGAPAPAPAVERRLFQYPGCTTYCHRWFITTDAVPLAYRTQAEALESLQRRQADRRRT